MHLIRKIRICLCLAFLSLLLVGNPICVKYNCENGVDQVEIKANQNTSITLTEIEKCKPTGLKCERILFSSILPSSAMDTPRMIISSPFAFFTLFGLLQLVDLIFGSDSSLKNDNTVCGFTQLGGQYLFEALKYATQVLSIFTYSTILLYMNFASEYRPIYFAAIKGVYFIGLFAYLAELVYYFIGNPESTNQDEQEAEFDL